MCDYETIVNLTANTITAMGVTVTCQLDRCKNPKGRKISDKQMKEIKIKRNKFHGEWNFVITPRAGQSTCYLYFFTPPKLREAITFTIQSKSSSEMIPTARKCSWKLSSGRGLIVLSRPFEVEDQNQRALNLGASTPPELAA